MLHRIDDKSLGIEAYLAVQDDPTAPTERRLAFGGLRISPTVDAATVESLSKRMSVKLALHGVPISGAKAGIRCAPDQLQAQRAAREAGVAGGQGPPGRLRTDCHRSPELVRAFIESVREQLLSHVIIGKDMGASDALLDQCYEILGKEQLHLIRKKHPGSPPRIRDLSGYRPHMTGLGVAWAVAAALEHAGMPVRGARVLIQGAGRVGLGAAVRLTELGAQVVGVSDRAKAIASREGIAPDRLAAAIDAEGSIDPARCAFPHQVLPRDELLALEGAEVLVLAADSNVISEAIATRIHAAVIAEGANAAILPAADLVLRRRGRFVVPDAIASSSSGALVGHQMASGNAHDPDSLWHRIERSIRDATGAALRESERSGPEITTRQAIAALIAGGYGGAAG